MSTSPRYEQHWHLVVLDDGSFRILDRSGKMYQEFLSGADDMAGAWVPWACNRAWTVRGQRRRTRGLLRMVERMNADIARDEEREERARRIAVEVAVSEGVRHDHR